MYSFVQYTSINLWTKSESIYIFNEFSFKQKYWNFNKTYFKVLIYIEILNSEEFHYNGKYLKVYFKWYCVTLSKQKKRNFIQLFYIKKFS